MNIELRPYPIRVKFNILFFVFFFVSYLAAATADEIITRKNYTLSFNNEHKIPNWVAYDLDLRKLQKCVERDNNFRPDPLVKGGTATKEDYYKSGFDRGHLLPAGDMKFDKNAMRDSFYFSNISPQPPKFNQGKWNRLEMLFRSWALKYEKVWIVTGPILDSNLPTIGNRNRISVPAQYFKVMIRPNGNGYKGIGFVMGTNVPFESLSAYATTINHVEELTGVDYFQFLDDDKEEAIEETLDLGQWDFDAKFGYLPCETSAI